jgi:hypothetical protein
VGRLERLRARVYALYVVVVILSFLEGVLVLLPLRCENQVSWNQELVIYLEMS